MNLQQLSDFKKQLNISSDQILREEAEMIFLDELAKNKLSAKLVFYGGTALRLVYNSPCFSEDIDLIRVKSISFLEFKKFIQEVIEKNPRWRLKDLKNERNTLFALISIKDNNRTSSLLSPRRSLSAEDCDEKARSSLQSSAERLQRGGSEEVLNKLKRSFSLKIEIHKPVKKIELETDLSFNQKPAKHRRAVIINTNS